MLEELLRATSVLTPIFQRLFGACLAPLRAADSGQWQRPMENF